MKIEELKKDLYLGDYGEEITNYSSGYICDILTEIADNNVDLYNYDLLQWVANDLYNIAYCDEAKDELGADDLITMIQGGQYLKYSSNLYENLEDIVKYYVFDYIENVLKLEEITEEQLNELEFEIDFTDNNEKLENINDKIDNVFNNKEE